MIKLNARVAPLFFLGVSLLICQEAALSRASFPPTGGKKIALNPSEESFSQERKRSERRGARAICDFRARERARADVQISKQTRGFCATFDDTKVAKGCSPLGLFFCIFFCEAKKL